MLTILLLLSSTISIEAEVHYLNFADCLTNNSIIDLDDYPSVTLDGTFKNEKNSIRCSFKFSASTSKHFRFVGVKIKTFYAKYLYKKNITKASIILNKTTLISISANASIYEFALFDKVAAISKDLLDELKLQFDVVEYSNLIISITFTNIYFCIDATLFCGETYKQQEICIHKSLECDNFVHCFATIRDEGIICYMNSTSFQTIPIIILALSLFLAISWVTCRIFCWYAESNGSISWLPLPTRVMSDRSRITTPDNLQAPPLYSSHSSGQNVAQIMPAPTYSNIDYPSIRPDFFQRFFGAPKNTISNVQDK